MSEAYLQISDLKKSFGPKMILRGVNLTVKAGERAALLGANGAGKTTLLRILAGLTRANAGRITIDRLDLAQQTREVRRKVGFIAHQAYLYEDLTSLENLLFFARMYDVEQPQIRAMTLLTRVGLSKKANERSSALSRGQVQRLAVARALLHQPQLLLLDEAETGLDEKGLQLLELLLSEHHEQGGTTLFTTHNLEQAIARSDQIIMLSQGRVVYQQATAGQDAENIRLAYQEVLR